MKLKYLGIWIDRVVYIHEDCTMSHADFVESLGHKRETVLIGCNAYVDSFKRTCAFCKQKFIGQFPHETREDVTLTIYPK